MVDGFDGCIPALLRNILFADRRPAASSCQQRTGVLNHSFRFFCFAARCRARPFLASMKHRFIQTAVHATGSKTNYLFGHHAVGVGLTYSHGDSTKWLEGHSCSLCWFRGFGLSGSMISIDRRSIRYCTVKHPKTGHAGSPGLFCGGEFVKARIEVSRAQTGEGNVSARVEMDKGDAACLEAERAPRLADCDGPPPEEHQVRLQGF